MTKRVKDPTSAVQAPTSLVKEPINHSFVELPGSDRVVLSGAKALGPANPHAKLEVLLKLKGKKELPEVADRPATPISRDSLASQYGASEQDMQTVEQTLNKFGLQIVARDPATRSVRVLGTVAEMEKAFQTRLFNYSHPEGNYRGRVGALHVPEELKGIVRGVFGLDNRRTARRARGHRTLSQKQSMSTTPSSWYLPSQLAAHYDFPQGDGSGQTVGVLEFGGGYFEADLQNYCAVAGVSMPNVVPISADGTATNAEDGAEGEVMLDVEIVAGACPKATIAVYFAQFTEQGWLTVLDKALQDKTNNPRVLSISWGFPEKAGAWTMQAMTQVNEALKEAALLGVTVCAASGDDGSSAAVDDGLAHVIFPGSSPYVLSVGGTTIPVKNGTQPDICWHEGSGLRSDGVGSTGGGVSAVFARPSWQSGVTIQSVNPRAINGRCIPDLAADADWTASPYLLVVDGGSQPNGGTSAATPLVASLITLINGQRSAQDPVGYLTPVLYQTSTNGQTIGQAGCTDVVSGNNNTAQVGGYSAGLGYDAVSGWGMPNGVALMQALAGAAKPTLQAAE